MRIRICFLCFLLLPAAIAQSSDWREQTDSLIAEHRRGDVVVRVMSADLPVSDASVSIKQQHHDFWFGTAMTTAFGLIDSLLDTTGVQQMFEDTLLAYFNTTVHEWGMKWPACEPKQDSLHWNFVDPALDWCDANQVRMRGHCIFWANENAVPEWARALSDSELIDEMRERVYDLLPRYRGRIGEYDVNNEMIQNSYLRDRLGISIIDSMFTWAHNADPNAILYLNEYGILNEMNSAVGTYAWIIDTLLSWGLPVGGIGIQGHFYTRDVDHGDSLFDPSRIWSILDTLSQSGLPIKITEFDVNAPHDTIQARWTETFYRVVLSHPAVSGILMWGFWERAHWRPETAIFRNDFSPKPAALAYHHLVYNEWWTDSTAMTDTTGESVFRPFFGKHLITVCKESTTVETLINFPRGLPEPLEVVIDLAVGIEERNVPLPTGNLQLSIRPNPATTQSGVSICLSSPADGEAGLQIYDLSGRLVRSFQISKSPDLQIIRLSWDRKNNAGKLVPSGIYFVKIEAGNKLSKTKKLLLLR